MTTDKNNAAPDLQPAELAKQQGGWAAMDTAPKDGTEVLIEVELRAGVRGKCLAGHYMAGGHCIEDHPPIAGGWYFWNGCAFDMAAKPIRWRYIQPAQGIDLGQADMFWLAVDGERFGVSVEELIDDLQDGEEIEIQAAVSLPNFWIRVKSDGSSVDFDLIDSQRDAAPGVANA
ncbi:hypothetical protein [Stenotrophomonas sp. PS02301]|uniref:hypothetical protein n=1 Tax=Stenotrophomonas sp. PS02301 TaxID=2991427 RepID=UPI00249A0844|nr:hypothetical protein [Stenotrophomonas sp. PS02301]